MPGQRRARVRYGDDRDAETDGLVEQAEGERVAGAVCPFVERVERAGCYHHGIGWWQDVGLVGLLVVGAHDMTGQLGEPGYVHELEGGWRGDDADLPPVGPQRGHEGGEVAGGATAAGDDVDDGS